MKKLRNITVLLLTLALAFGCVTQKKKGAEPNKFKKGYHNITSKYNYWFNADELFRLTSEKLAAQNKDNYNQLLDLYPETVADPQSAKGDLDNVITKSSKGIALHRVGDFTDDCYTMIGQAQYMKRDYETAESTFRYIKDEHDPKKKMKTKLVKKKKDSVKKKKLSPRQKKKIAKKKKKAAAKKKKEAQKNKKKGIKTDKTKAPDTPTTDVKTNKVDPKKDDNELVVTGNNPYKKGIKRTAAYPNAMIWYGRTLIAREKYDEAEFLFRELEEDAWFPAQSRADLAMAEANMWIKQKRYDKAIEPLSKAITLIDKRKKRARPSFILAQLYERVGRAEAAYAAYETVLRSSPQYDMEFNARLRQTEAGWINGTIASAAANKTLEQMLRDDKNSDYRDQIYFVQAEIALKDNQKKEAIVFLRKSLDNNKGNVAQRAESYLTLADLYFEAEDFVQAKNYYDSTLTVLPATDERREHVTLYATNLTDIARLIKTITANDSIVAIYNMDDAQRKDFAKKLKKKREEIAEADAKKQAAAAPATGPGTKAPAPVAGAKSNTSFYFYNDNFLKKGRKDFNKTWGDRKLEDNWRRSSRPSTGVPGDEVAAADSTQNDGVSDNELKDIFQNIPKGEAELSVLHLSTYEAMYQLGTLYRDKLQNNRRAASTLEDMQTRYSDSTKYNKFEKETWYYCYLAFSDLQNKARAQYYLDRLVGKYPNSAYARAITDPNFRNATEEKEREINNYYKETFTTFQSSKYQEAYDRCQEAPKKYGSQNPLMPKFFLLSALCVGNLQGNEAYCKALSEVIARYPESAEATRAKEIARLMSCKGFEVPADDPKKKTEEIDDKFTKEDDKLHYIIVVFSGDVRLDDVKVAISDYNREFHKLEQLRLNNIFLGTDTNTPMVVIRKFDNREQAMRYYNEVKDQKDFLGETTKKTYTKEIYPVTQENYRRILKNKTLEGYRDFFAESYLK